MGLLQCSQIFLAYRVNFVFVQGSNHLLFGCLIQSQKTFHGGVVSLG